MIRRVLAALFFAAPTIAVAEVEIAVRPDGVALACSIDGVVARVADCAGRKARFAVPQPQVSRDWEFRVGTIEQAMPPGGVFERRASCRRAVVSLPGEARALHAPPTAETERLVRLATRRQGTLHFALEADLDGDGQPELVFHLDNLDGIDARLDPSGHAHIPFFGLTGVVRDGKAHYSHVMHGLYFGGTDAIPDIGIGGFTLFPLSAAAPRLITYVTGLDYRLTQLWALDADCLALIGSNDECIGD
jgi:hypothetical protein